MGSVRRSSLQVYMDYMAELKALENQRRGLEADAANVDSPVHWAAIKAIAEIALAIAAIVRKLKRRKRKRTA